MTPVFITIFILVSFLSIIALGIAVSAEVKVKNVTNLVKLTQDSVITGKPLTIVLTLTIDDAFSTNQYVFIAGFGNFIVDSVETNICTVFNLQALEDTTIPVNTIVHPSGSGTFSRTTKPATVLAGTFSLFVRDSCFLDKSVVFESSSGILSMTVLSITAISNIEAELSVLNSDGVGIGSFVPVLSKVSLCGTGGAAGTSGSGLLAKVESIVSVANFGTGVTVTIPISEGFDNLHGPRPTSGLPDSLLYLYILSDVGGVPYNLYFQVDVKNTSPDEVDVTLVDNQINAPFDIPPGVDTLTIAEDTGIFFAGDSPAYATSGSSVTLQEAYTNGDGIINTAVSKPFTVKLSDDVGTDAFVIKDSTDTTKLEINSDGNIIMGSYSIQHNGSIASQINAVGDSNFILNGANGSDYNFSLADTGGNSKFRLKNSSGQTRFEIASSGQTVFYSLLRTPNDNTHDIGTSSLRWKNVFATKLDSDDKPLEIQTTGMTDQKIKFTTNGTVRCLVDNIGSNFTPDTTALNMNLGVTGQRWGDLYTRNIWTDNTNVIVNKILIPNDDGLTDLGSTGAKWKDIWAVNDTIQVSDRNEKEDIEDSTLGLEFVKALKTKKFKYKGDPSPRRGLIAQDVKDVMNTQNVEFSGYRHFDAVPPVPAVPAIIGVKYVEARDAIPEIIVDGEVIQEAVAEVFFVKGVDAVPGKPAIPGYQPPLALGMTAFITPLIKSVQELSLQNQTLMTNVTTLTARIAALENP